VVLSFADEILGVVVDSTKLNATDPLFTFADPMMSTDLSSRGLLLGGKARISSRSARMDTP
jgi:hypothetical protein